MKPVYSPIPALQEFVEPEILEDGAPSRMESLSVSLLQVQMDLSRIVLHEESCDTQTRQMVCEAMMTVADIYDVFQDIEAERRKYVEAMEKLE